MNLNAAHPRPEALAIAECSHKPMCHCAARGMPVGQRINRRRCERGYMAAVRKIIDAALGSAKILAAANFPEDDSQAGRSQ